MKIEELKQTHREKSGDIRARLDEFRQIGLKASDEKLFEELVFCIFTAAASARMGLRSVERVRSCLFTGSKRRIQGALLHTHRWPRARGALVFETREYLRQLCGLRMRELLRGFESADARRDFFARNPGVRGLGYKEASHFLRNVGYCGYSILDKHVLGRLHEFGVVDGNKPPTTRRRYLEVESRMKEFASSVGIDFDELDLVLWYSKTGEILK